MTTPVSNIPISIDYTSRDYYALRDALIQRVKERTGNKWSGNDPSDFGVALVESFAYMGDLVNYYIDRVANESYIGTATQRQNVLNLASMLGYTAGGYTSATVNVTLTNSVNVGYRGQVGASQLSGGIARLVIPNDNTFEVGNLVNVSNLTRSEYNGTFTITSKNLGANEIEFVPLNSSVTAAGNGTIVVFTTPSTHNILIGEIVTTSGFTGGSTAYNLANKTVTAVTATTFTVTAAVSGTATGGVVKYADIATGANINGYVHDIGYVTVPAGTQLFSEISDNGVVYQVIFTTLTTAAVPYVNDDGTGGSQTVIARHGIDVSTLSSNQANSSITPDINGELIGYSTGEADQVVSLIETEVDISTLIVYVENGNTFDTWTAVQYLEDYTSTDKVYRVSIDADDNIFINFGDGIGGIIPTKGSRIKAAYYKGSGLLGNIPAYSIKSIYDVPGATTSARTLIMSKVTPSNAVAATGGDGPESLDSIRHNAPSALRALNRAVTLEDFSNLALSIPRVGKANAVASLPTSISVYIAPERSTSNNETTPGITRVDTVDTPTPDLVILKSEVSSFLADKSQIGTTVTILEPKYSYIYTTIQYSKLTNYSQTAVESAIRASLLTTYSYDNLDFQNVITPQMIEDTLRKVDGVQNVLVKYLYKTGSGAGKTTLAGDFNEIFVFTDGNTTLEPSSNESRLDVSGGLTSSITITPTYNQNVYQYTATTSASSITLTATASLGTIAIANMATVSGASRTITLNTGVNSIEIAVTAADGITTSKYTVTVVKS